MDRQIKIEISRTFQLDSIKSNYNCQLLYLYLGLYFKLICLFLSKKSEISTLAKSIICLWCGVIIWFVSTYFRIFVLATSANLDANWAKIRPRVHPFILSFIHLYQNFANYKVEPIDPQINTNHIKMLSVSNNRLLLILRVVSGWSAMHM